MAWLSLCTEGKPCNSKCKCAVCFGTWKSSQNATVCGVKQWGFDSPIMFVPVTPYTQKYCYVLWSDIQLFVNKPMYSGLVLSAVTFTGLFNPPEFGSLQPKPSPHCSFGLALLHYSISQCWQTMDNGNVKTVWKTTKYKHGEHFPLKSCPWFLFPCLYLFIKGGFIQFLTQDPQDCKGFPLKAVSCCVNVPFKTGFTVWRSRDCASLVYSFKYNQQDATL